MRDVVRLGTILCVIGIIASMGGYQHNMFGLVGMFGRMAVFAVLMWLSLQADNLLTQRKRARRRAILKAQKTNKYEVICHG